MNNENITRAEAIKKMGKYAAFTALGTMIILNPKTAQAMSCNFLALNDIEDLSPKRDPVRASLTPLGCMPLGRSSAHDFLLDVNGSGGIREDNLHDFPRHAVALRGDSSPGRQ